MAPSASLLQLTLDFLEKRKGAKFVLADFIDDCGQPELAHQIRTSHPTDRTLIKLAIRLIPCSLGLYAAFEFFLKATHQSSPSRFLQSSIGAVQQSAKSHFEEGPHDAAIEALEKFGQTKTDTLVQCVFTESGIVIEEAEDRQAMLVDHLLTSVRVCRQLFDLENDGGPKDQVARRTIGAQNSFQRIANACCFLDLIFRAGPGNYSFRHLRLLGQYPRPFNNTRSQQLAILLDVIGRIGLAQAV